MMFISQITLDRSRRSTMKALSSPQVMHAIIERVFEDSERNLWRLDDNNLLVVSQTRPFAPNVSLQELGGTPVTKNYAAYMKNIENGKEYRFRLTVNPVKSVPSAKGNDKQDLAAVPCGFKRGRGDVVPLKQSQYESWLLSKAEGLGVAFGEFKMTSSQTVKFKHGKASDKNTMITLAFATFDGILAVTDRELVTRAMSCGVGRAKAYGAGMLTLM